MTNNEKAVLLEKLSENQEFLQAFSAVQSKDELQKVFNNFGLEMTREEIDAFVHMIGNSGSDELNVDDLESVSGGVDALTVLGWAWKGIKAVSKTAWNAGKKLANWESNR